MKNVEKIATELFDKIRSRFDGVVLGDDQANETTQPDKARFINFNYKSKSGQAQGNVTLSLIDENSLKIYFSKNLSDKFSELDQKEWYDFLKDLRYFSKRNLLTFDTRDINRDNLTVRDVKNIAQTGSAYTISDTPTSVTESKLYGTTRTSIQDFGPVKMIVRHSEAVNEEIPGSRSRKIHAIFLETELGERFLMPFNKLSAGRAMAQHLVHGGQVHDDFGKKISGIVEEMHSLAFFVRSTKNRMFEDAETQAMVESAVERYQLLRNDLRRMSGRRGYQHYAENFQPESSVVNNVDVEALKERFVQKMFDDRLTQALPYVYRAYQEKQMSNRNSYVDEFNNWAQSITEGEWLLPDDDMAQIKLRKLMSQPLEVGIDANDATGAIGDVIGSDSLYDDLADLSQISGPNADARPVIIKWLKDHMYTELAKEFEEMIKPGTVTAPSDSTTAESSDSGNQDLDSLRRLAGL